MRFLVTADTDVGISKNTNQDSVLIKHASSKAGEVLMAIVCDGMGGLSRGELASATVVRAFSKWFDEELPYELMQIDMQVIGTKWSLFLKELNVKINEFSERDGKGKLGTTFSGILLINDEYMIAHVGDSRVYKITSMLEQLTTDQTFVAREVRLGNMTPQQAKTDKRRNLLLQCIGASKIVEPEIIFGKIEHGVYMLCTDGFRHEIRESEILEYFNPGSLNDKETMHDNARYLIELVKSRKERDNISVLLIKSE